MEVFGQKMHTIQLNHWNKYRYYPSNKSKQWVIEHYVNPWDFLAECSASHWSDDARDWHVKHEITSADHLPESPMTWGEYWVANKRTVERIKEWVPGWVEESNQKDNAEKNSKDL